MTNRSCSLLLSFAIAAAACSDDNPGENDDGVGAGTITDTWRAYCIATFTQNHDVIDVFGDTVFTATAGQQYLMEDYGESFGESSATLLYLTPMGPYDFKLVAPDGTADFPFTSNCAFDGGRSYYAAFTDVAVFASEALSMKLCDIAAGTALPRTPGITGSIASDLSFSSGPSTYEIYLNAFSAGCGGAESGFVSVPETEEEYS